MKYKRIRNSSREADVICRECKKCLRVYKGNNAICPYCGYDNGKTKKQIEEDKKMELERITQIQIKQSKKEVGMAKTRAELIAIGTRRGYKNPGYWAECIINGRQNKLKKY